MTELNYAQCGDYLLPEMELSEEDKAPLGRYGEIKYRYLEENHPGLFTRLFLSGQLMHQLQKWIGRQSEGWKRCYRRWRRMPG